MTKHIAVIGGGIAGTSAAHHLIKLGHTVTIIESQSRLGGRIRSESYLGSDIEMGAGFIASSYSNILDYLKANDMGHLLKPRNSRSSLYKDSQLVAPSFRTLLANEPLSWGAKALAISLLGQTVMLWPWLHLKDISKASRFDDRTISDMFESPAGQELLEYALQPVLNGYFYWTPEQTSRAMLLWLCRASFSHHTYRLSGGLHQIPTSLASGSTILLNHAVANVTSLSNGYELTMTNNKAKILQQFDGVVCATTATHVTSILPELTDKQREFFDSVHYSATALTAEAYLSAHDPGNLAIAYPRQEGTHLASVTIATDERKNGDYLPIIKKYASGMIGKDLSHAKDKQVISDLDDLSARTLSLVLPKRGKPQARFVQKWPEALPLFDVGHFVRLKEFYEGRIESKKDPLVFAGDYIGGPYMDGAFLSGRRAAERLDVKLADL